jgi:hypothetical protein
LLNNEQFIKVRIASIRHHHRVARFNVYLSWVIIWVDNSKS